jgi:hypothetical protein
MASEPQQLQRLVIDQDPGTLAMTVVDQAVVMAQQGQMIGRLQTALQTAENRAIAAELRLAQLDPKAQDAEGAQPHDEGKTG